MKDKKSVKKFKEKGSSSSKMVIGQKQLKIRLKRRQTYRGKGHVQIS